MSSTYNKYRLLAAINTTMYHAEPIIKARIDVGSFEEFSVAYAAVYEQLHCHYEELTNSHELLQNKIDELKVFSPTVPRVSVWSIYHFIAYFFSKYKEANKVGEVREIYNTISVIKMFIDNAD